MISVQRYRSIVVRHLDQGGPVRGQDGVDRIDDETIEIVDYKTNRVIFKGSVSLKQGSINIDAAKIVVTRDPKTESIQQIQALGSPATFSQLMEDGKTLSGQANQINYRISTDELTMKGQAQLKQDGNTIQGSSIRYQIGQQKLVADSSKSERVTTVLQPNQIEN